MAYQRGFLNKRIGVLNRADATTSHGAKVGGSYALTMTIWANVSFTKGMKAMREGQIDAYDYKMVRCDYHSQLTRNSRLMIDGETYQIQSFDASHEKNEMQIVCFELQK